MISIHANYLFPLLVKRITFTLFQAKPDSDALREICLNPFQLNETMKTFFILIISIVVSGYTYSQYLPSTAITFPDLKSSTSFENDSIRNKIRAYIQMNRYHDAELACNELVEAFPLDPNVYQIRFELFKKILKTRAALLDINKVLELSNYNYKVYLDRAEFKLEFIGDFSGAILDCDSAIGRAKENELYICYCMRGYAYCQSEKFENGIDDLNRSIELNKNYPRSFGCRGDAYFKTNKFPLAIADYKAYIRIKEDDIQPYVQIASIYRENKSYKDAIKILNKCLKKNPQNAEVYRDLGVIKMQSKDFAGAKKDFTVLTQLTPTDGAAFYYLGQAEHFLENNEAACKIMLTAKKLHSHEAFEYIKVNCKDLIHPKIIKALDLLETSANRGEVALYYYDTIVRVCTEAIKVSLDSETFAAMYYMRATANNKLENYNEAIADYKMALDYNKKLDKLSYSLGCVQIQIEEYENAINSFKNAIELNPSDASSYYGLGYIYCKQRKFKEAIVYLNETINFKNNYMDAYLLLGNCYEELKDSKNACMYYKQAEALGSIKAISKRIYSCSEADSK
jgi:tetratricopeptide (TPR) repeat protein